MIIEGEALLFFVGKTVSKEVQFFNSSFLSLVFIHLHNFAVITKSFTIIRKKDLMFLLNLKEKKLTKDIVLPQLTSGS